jgi:hypothetical protein
LNGQPDCDPRIVVVELGGDDVYNDMMRGDFSSLDQILGFDKNKKERKTPGSLRGF